MTVKTRTVEERVVVCDACGEEMPDLETSKGAGLLAAVTGTCYTKHVKPDAKRKGKQYAPEDYWCLCRRCQAELECEYDKIASEAKRKRKEALAALVGKGKVESNA